MNRPRFHTSILINYLVGWLLLTTPALLVWQHFGMTRTLEISPRHPHGVRLTDDHDIDKGTSVSSLTITEDAFVMRCKLGPGYAYPFCKLQFMLGVPGKGMDLSQFDTMTFNMRYSSRSPRVLKLHLMNFEPEFSTLEDWNSQRFNEAELEPGDRPSFTIPLNALRTANWWRGAHRVPLSHSLARLDKVTAVELSTGAVEPELSTMELRSIEFRGKWISRPTLLKYLVGAWIGCGMLSLFQGLLHYRAGLAASDARLSQLAAINKALELETRELADQAQTDTLTGALNRQGLRTVLLKGLQRPGRARGRVAVIFMDLDHFKQVNDHHGHEVGDEVLRRFAAVVRGAVRGGDHLVRWGGEEFLLVCPGTGGEQAAQAAEKLRSAVSAAEWPHGLQLTASFGATVLRPEEDIGAAIARADGALYAAKSNGRNRVELV